MVVSSNRNRFAGEFIDDINGILASLTGANLVQAYYYYHHYPRDTVINRLGVSVLSALDMFHLFLITHFVYHYVIKHFGDLLALGVIVWSIKLQVVVNCIGALRLRQIILQLTLSSLYAHRVWMLGGYHNSPFGYFVGFFVVAGPPVGAIFVYKVYTIKMYSQLPKISWSIVLAFATSTLLDVVLGGAMFYYLRKSKGSEPQLNTRISRIILYTVGSGLLTAAASLSSLFTYVYLQRTFIFIGIEFLVTKLYLGSFLALLNSRQRSPSHDYVEPRTIRLSNISITARTSPTRALAQQQSSPTVDFETLVSPAKALTLSWERDT
ncbi:hypothetical protein AX17_002763, partial [Amanita inopinata Kibby_2008]